MSRLLQWAADVGMVCDPPVSIGETTTQLGRIGRTTDHQLAAVVRKLGSRLRLVSDPKVGTVVCSTAANRDTCKLCLAREVEDRLRQCGVRFNPRWRHHRPTKKLKIK